MAAHTQTVVMQKILIGIKRRLYGRRHNLITNLHQEDGKSGAESIEPRRNNQLASMRRGCEGNESLA